MPDEELDICPACERGGHGECHGMTWSDLADGYTDCQCESCF